MPSVGPWHGGANRRGSGGWGTPFFGTLYSSDLWDRSIHAGDQLGWSRGGDQNDEVSALAHANVDWRETDKAHIFRVDLPGVRKQDLKMQVEDGNILQISGERVKKRSKRTISDTGWKGGVEGS